MPHFEFEYEEFASEDELIFSEKKLLQQAKQVTEKAYAPYSLFHVGASVLLHNGKMIQGVNIENASYPVGICAERSALASAISQFPDEKIVAIAISYFYKKGENNQPAFPCGMCRQFISECEDRNGDKIILILGAQQGTIVRLATSKHLLPFSFSGSNLG